MKRILFPNRFHWMLVPATDTMIKLFNQSIRRLRLTKTKSLIFASLLVGALVTLLSVPFQAAGPSPLDPGGQPADTFSILLSGKYKTVPAKPMVDCPNIGLYVCDGTFSTTKIYPISGLPGEDSGQGNSSNPDRETEDAIGNFYVQLASPNFVAYDLPGGSLTMVFTADNLVSVPDGHPVPCSGLRCVKLCRLD